jgi:hypothetical protein
VSFDSLQADHDPPLQRAKARVVELADFGFPERLVDLLRAEAAIVPDLYLQKCAEVAARKGP